MASFRTTLIQEILQKVFKSTKDVITAENLPEYLKAERETNIFPRVLPKMDADIASMGNEVKTLLNQRTDQVLSELKTDIEKVAGDLTNTNTAMFQINK